MWVHSDIVVPGEDYEPSNYVYLQLKKEMFKGCSRERCEDGTQIYPNSLNTIEAKV